ncbi:hypothetical protein, partial [Rhizobium leguminosarum]|uniref:hypothetical protein n=1 Tax=Rhizobium leguminosarum TaxID=384 RepID=UPI001C950E5C
MPENLAILLGDQRYLEIARRAKPSDNLRFRTVALERDCFSRNRNRDSLCGANQIHHSGRCRRLVWMAKPFSDDLRERVVGAVMREGLSCR